MKKLFYFIFLFFSFNCFSQQVFELCGDESKTITYYVESTGDGSNIWTVNGNTYVGDELTYTFDQSGVYNITVKRENGPCYVEESMQVIVTECPGIIYWVPNTFTPDGNEFNQLFGPIITEGIDINGFIFTIYNRWGQVIWETNDLNGRWDGTYGGKMCQDGVYTWKIVFNVFGNDEKIQNTGHLSLIK